MNRVQGLEANEERVRELYPQLIEVLKNDNMNDAGCALCTALTILAFRHEYCLASLLWLVRGSLEQGWYELNKWGLPMEADLEPLPNGEENYE
jgi:hypothetical protein